MKLKVSLLLALLIICNCNGRIEYFNAEDAIRSAKDVESLQKVFMKLGLPKNYMDSLSETLAHDLFSAPQLIRKISQDSLAQNGKCLFHILRLRFFREEYLSRFDELVDLISIRNTDGRTVFTRGYVFSYCDIAEPSVEIKKIADNRYGIETVTPVSCGTDVVIENRCDTLVVKDKELFFRPSTTPARSNGFNRFQKINEGNGGK
jgi:hypothetical protein